MKKILIACMALFAVLSQAQVGIGVTNPTAHLDIDGNSTGMPALELNPQRSPVGSETGQLSVIEDKLYMYDDARGKWLSIEQTILDFGLLGGADGQEIEYVGDVEDSGPRMPFAGTIVYVTMNATGGQTNKQVQLYKNDVAIPFDTDPSESGLLTMNTYAYTDTTYNVDFEAGDWFRVEVSSAGSAVQNITVVLKAKWRQ